MDYVKIYGLRRSGTNYLEALLNNNFNDLQVLTNTLGWKHGKVKDFKQYPDLRDFKNDKELLNSIDNNEVKKIFLIKEPYAWVNSITNYCKKHSDNNCHKWSIEDFIKRYNEINKDYIENFKKDYNNSVIIFYEELISNPEKYIDIISDKFNFSKEKEFKDINKKIGPNLSISGQQFNKKYYKQGKYLEELNEETKTEIETNIDKEVLEFIEENNTILKEN